MTKQEMLAYIQGRAEDFYNLSDKIWDYAEVRFTEEKSAADFVEFLENEGFKVTKDIAGLKTAFMAEWGEGAPTIGFLGEYDALPELSQDAGVATRTPTKNPDGTIKENTNGHGCGHNLLGVGSLMAAIGFKKYLQENAKSGKIIYFGCPAEEGGSGKTFMARAGLFNNLDCALSWHPAHINAMPPGIVLANSMARFTFTGTSSHAAASPDKGRSALDALELMNVGIQFLREHIPQEARVHYAITDTGGNAPNVVQSHASGIYQIRAPHSPDVADIYRRVCDIARGAALMTETKVNIQYLKGTSNTVLIPALDEAMHKNLTDIPNPVKDASDLDFAWEIVKTQVPAGKMPQKDPIDFRVLSYNKNAKMPLPGSSDTGDVSWNCPLTQCGIAAWPVGTMPHTWQSTACGKSDFAHRGMLYAAQVLAATAADVIEHPEILEEAKQQFEERTKDAGYRCPIPDEITPQWLAKEIN